MKNEKKTFAFKLASRAEESKDQKWTCREGVTASGCTNTPTGTTRFGGQFAADTGPFC